MSSTLEETFSCTTITIDTLVVVEVGNYALYGLEVVLCMGYSPFCSLYSSLSLSVALWVEGSGEGVEDRCLLCPFLYCAICPSKLGTPV